MQKKLNHFPRKFQLLIPNKSYLFCKIFGYGYHEYRYYHFEKKSLLERLSFVSNRESENVYRKFNKTITNKKDNYQLLKEFYKRDICILLPKADNNEQLLRDFVASHNQFIAKSFTGAGSQGIELITAEPSDSWIQSFSESHMDGVILEELINQTEELSLVHPESVNTLRINTVNNSGNIDSIHPVMRFGTGKNFCDNSSGLLCAVDLKTGKIFAASDLQGNAIVCHPDSSVNLIGFEIPEFEQAVNLAKKLALLFPDNLFMGWDLAHTSNGWILVEANTESRFTVWQLPEQKGFRKELKTILKMK